MISFLVQRFDPRAVRGQGVIPNEFVRGCGYLHDVLDHSPPALPG